MPDRLASFCLERSLYEIARMNIQLLGDTAQLYIWISVGGEQNCTGISNRMVYFSLDRDKTANASFAVAPCIAQPSFCVTSLPRLLRQLIQILIISSPLRSFQNLAEGLDRLRPEPHNKSTLEVRASRGLPSKHILTLQRKHADIGTRCRSIRKLAI